MIDERNIPPGALEASRALQYIAMQEGWAGLNGHGLWSLEGIGPVLMHKDKIARLEADLKSARNLLNRAMCWVHACPVENEKRAILIAEHLHYQKQHGNLDPT